MSVEMIGLKDGLGQLEDSFNVTYKLLAMFSSEVDELYYGDSVDKSGQLMEVMRMAPILIASLDRMMTHREEIKGLNDKAREVLR